ncbi:DUF4158 domain-containing protein [Burkholderia cenocepacia]|nr:DUF4158 domain-containing protein [Burkholderia cenocepacia]MEB2558739.1 DUF4158 domain-containing protein [Burkholderia cenocepacia]
MASLERTAYPRFPKVLSAQDLQVCYTPSPDELEWARRSSRGHSPRLGLLVLLKIFQRLHYFPPVDSIPPPIVEHVRAAANLNVDVPLPDYDRKASPILFRHYRTVRSWLNVKPYYGTDANEIATRAAHEASQSMDQPVDLVNATIEALVAQNIELPAFSTLDLIAEQIHAKAQARLFRLVSRRLSNAQKRIFDRLLARDLSQRQTDYHRVKRHAKRPSRQNLDLLINQMTWLDGLGDFAVALAGIPTTILRSLAAQAETLDASALKTDTHPDKRYTLIAALLNRMRVRVRDDLAEMFVRRMGAAISPPDIRRTRYRPADALLKFLQAL